MHSMYDTTRDDTRPTGRERRELSWEGRMAQHRERRLHGVSAQEKGGVDAPKDLIETIEREVIPRLVLAHRGEGVEVACEGARGAPTEAEIIDFARIAVAQDLDAALAQVDAFAQDGLGLESIYMELIAPTARMLGENWQADLYTFSDVTAGLGTLQKLVQVLGPSFAPDAPHRGLCVLVAAPGEQHTLGLFLVGEFLRRAGWGIELVPSMTLEELLALVSTAHVAMVGFTVSVSDHLPALGHTIAAVRAQSRNQDLPIMVGGAIELTEFANQNDVKLLLAPRMVLEWMENWTRKNCRTRRLDT